MEDYSVSWKSWHSGFVGANLEMCAISSRAPPADTCTALLPIRATMQFPPDIPGHQLRVTRQCSAPALPS